MVENPYTLLTWWITSCQSIWYLVSQEYSITVCSQSQTWMFFLICFLVINLLLYYGWVWICVCCVHVCCNVCFSFFFSFFFAFSCKGWLFNREQFIRVLFTDPQILLFNNFFIKNGSHDTIHTFKNYFIIVFSVFNFQFQQNKFYPNIPYIILCKFFFFCFLQDIMQIIFIRYE